MVVLRMLCRSRIVLLVLAALHLFPVGLRIAARLVLAATASLAPLLGLRSIVAGMVRRCGLRCHRCCSRHCDCAQKCDHRSFSRRFEKLSNFRKQTWRRASGLWRDPVQTRGWLRRQGRSNLICLHCQLRRHWLNHRAGHRAVLRAAVMLVGCRLVMAGAIIHGHRCGSGRMGSRRPARHRDGHDGQGQDNEQSKDQSHRPPALLVEGRFVWPDVDWSQVHSGSYPSSRRYYRT